MTFGQKIRELRKLNHLTIKQLSQLSGISSTEISKIERGLNVPRVKSISRLSLALGYDFVELYNLVY